MISCAVCTGSGLRGALSMINRGCLRCVGNFVGDLDFLNLALVGVWWGRSFEPGFYLCTHPASSGAKMMRNVFQDFSMFAA